MAVQVSLADDRAICEAAEPALARLPQPTGWFVGPIEAYLRHFNPAYVSKLLDVVEAAREMAKERKRDVTLNRDVFCYPALRKALAALKAHDRSAAMADWLERLRARLTYHIPAGFRDEDGVWHGRVDLAALLLDVLEAADRYRGAFPTDEDRQRLIVAVAAVEKAVSDG